MSSHLKEAVLYSYLLYSEYLTEYFADKLLRFCYWRNISSSCPCFYFGQRSFIQLSVSCYRDRFYLHHICGKHIFGQACAEPVSYFRHAYFYVACIVCINRLVSRAVLSCYYRAVFYALYLSYSAFYLSKLDSESSDLYLLVYSSQVLYISVGQPSC